jgi:ankyrin repeat protein
MDLIERRLNLLPVVGKLIHQANHPNRNGVTPLMVACLFGFEESVLALASRSVVLAEDVVGRSAFQYAALPSPGKSPATSQGIINILRQAVTPG